MISRTTLLAAVIGAVMTHCRKTANRTTAQLFRSGSHQLRPSFLIKLKHTREFRLTCSDRRKGLT